MSNNILVNDIGFTGDGDTVKSILADTYDVPTDTNPWTCLLLTEAALLFLSLGEGNLASWVNRQDFKKWWSTARESTKSSKSCLHFGHYKAGASDTIIF